MSERTSERLPPSRTPGRLKAYIELTKPRIALLVLTVAGRLLLPGVPSLPGLAPVGETACGVALLAFGIFALNHYIERDTDAMMLRTAHRPLPSGRLRPSAVLAFGAVLTTAAVVGITAALGPVAGGVAVFTFVSYIFIYTPLKRRTLHHTIPGAISASRCRPSLGGLQRAGTSASTPGRSSQLRRCN